MAILIEDRKRLPEFRQFVVCGRLGVVTIGIRHDHFCPSVRSIRDRPRAILAQEGKKICRRQQTLLRGVRTIDLGRGGYWSIRSSCSMLSISFSFVTCVAVAHISFEEWARIQAKQYTS